MLGGKIGVDLFIIISGYFLVNAKNINIKKDKIKKLILPVWIYSIIFLMIAIAFKLDISLGKIASSIFPVIFVNYWFITDYIILYFLAPYLNRLLDNLEKKEHFRLMIILMLITSIIPTFVPGSMKILKNNMLLFIFLYVTSSYVRKYPMDSEKRFGKYLFWMSSMVLISSMVILNILADRLNSETLYSHSAYFASDYSFIIYLIALGMFLWVKNWKIRPNKVINTIATTTFGIYLIHDNPFMRELIWIKLLNLPSLIYTNWWTILLAAIIVCTIYFVICILIGLVRQKLFQKILFRKVKNM